MKHFWYHLKNKLSKPYHTGFLPEKEGHTIYFQEVGNPNGSPLIVFHGGPGDSGDIGYTYTYDRQKYRIIIFDQRGCGRSLSQKPLEHNTIQDITKDAMRLLDYLNIKGKVTVAGGSWGSTCALHFSETYPNRVKRIIVYAVFLARQKDAQYMSPITPLFYPDAIEILKKQAKGQPLDKYFGKLLFSNNHQNNLKAMQYYKSLEEITSDASLSVNFMPRKFSDKEINEFRIYMHYQLNHFFLKPNQLLKEAKRIVGIPMEIYQNRLDPCCPPYQAYELHQAIPNSHIHILPDKGHISEQMFWKIYVDNVNDYQSHK